ncbi:MAG TPA: SHOCT domain-containing protein [Deinococcales bacterium]|nr:SHOCT domain-containing protein [Deinococcales bacterium]
MMGYGNFGYGGMGMLGGFWMLAFLALVIIGIIALVRHLSEMGTPGAPGATLFKSGPPSNNGSDPALAIARERLARGELSIEEFETIRRALG